MKTTFAILALALAAVFTPSAQAHDGGHWGHYHGGGFSFGFGLPLFYGGYYGSPYYEYGYPSYGYGRPYYYSAPYASYGYTSSIGTDVQDELARRGYYYGSIDGMIGPRSRDAIRRYQASHRLPVTGTIDGPLLRSLHL
jgi:hypothetical protein